MDIKLTESETKLFGALAPVALATRKLEIAIKGKSDQAASWLVIAFADLMYGDRDEFEVNYAHAWGLATLDDAMRGNDAALDAADTIDGWLAR